MKRIRRAVTDLRSAQVCHRSCSWPIRADPPISKHRLAGFHLAGRTEIRSFDRSTSKFELSAVTTVAPPKWGLWQQLGRKLSDSKLLAALFGMPQVIRVCD